MDSYSAVSLSSPPRPSYQSYSAPAGGESPDPEEYETASDPEVDETHSSAVEDNPLLPEENFLTSSAATEDQKNLSSDEGEVHDSSQEGFLQENSDSSRNSNDIVSGVGEKLEEDEEEVKLSSVPPNPTGNDDSGGGDVAKSKENGAGESEVGQHETLAGENGRSDSFATGASHDFDPKELAEGGSSFTATVPKVKESGGADSTSSLSQYVVNEVEPKDLKSESFVFASGEVGDDAQPGYAADVEHKENSVKLDEVLPANSDVLEDNRPDAVETDAMEVEAKPYADGAERFESIVANVNAGRELEVVDETEKKPVSPLEVDAIDEAVFKGSNGEVNLVKGEAPEFDSIDSNDEVVGKVLFENPEIVDSESAQGTSKNLDQIYYSENSERSYPLNPEIADEEDAGLEDPSSPSGPASNLETASEKVEIRSEHVSSPSQGEATVQLTADFDLNSTKEAEILPTVASGAVVEDDNTQGTSTEGLPQMSNTDKLACTSLNQGPTAENLSQKSMAEKIDEMSPNEISKSSTPNLEIANEKVVVGSEHVSSPGHGEAAVQLTADDVDLNSAVEPKILPVIEKETVAGDDYSQGSSTEGMPQMSNADTHDVTSLNQETAEEKVMVGPEDASGPSEGEPALQLTPDDGDLNSAVDVETHPVIAKGFIVGDDKIEENSTEVMPQNSNTDKLDGTSASQQSAEDKAVAGLENTSSHGEGESTLQLTAGGGDSKPTVEVETIPITSKETVVSGETLSHIPELKQNAEGDAGKSQLSAAEEGKGEHEDDDKRISDGPAKFAILDGPDATKQILREMEMISSSSQSSLQGSHNYSSNVDGQIISDSDEVLDSDEDGDGGELFDSAALAALLKAATGSSDGTVTVTAQDAARIFSGDRPVGLGASAPSLRPSAPRSARPSLFTPSEIAAVEEPDHSMDEDEKRLHEKVEQIRVKFLRLVHRLGHSPADAVAGQVLYRLSLAEGIKQGRQMSRAFSIESAKKQAMQLEEEGKDDLDFSCNILVLGKTGVGKSATINSIFGEERSPTNPFQLATASVREISGMVDGVRVRVIDTPGLKACITDQATNRKILSSIKNFTKKCPPDIVLYVDRMDTQTRDFNDLPLLRSITSILGSSIWFNAIVALTHAASAPPDGPNGSPLGYDVFVTQRSHVVQQSVRQAAGDMRLMNPVALVENHPSCRRNREGERILPNGLCWRPQLLLLSYASKILSEANSLLKLQDPSPGKLFGGFRLRSPPLPFLLSSLLQSRAHPKLSSDQGGDNADSDIDLDEFSDAEQDEEVDEYDSLPPFNPLKKSQIAMLTKEQKKAYFDEYDYRVKLLQKKQWKDAVRRLKETKKKGKDDTDEFTSGDVPEYYDQEGSPAAVPVPLPDMVLPPSFDCDIPAFRYRFLEPTSQLLTRPVLDAHGWDHDCGYDGVSIEESLAIAGRFPTSMAVQITKDKKEFNIHLDSSLAVKHGEHGSTLAGFDIQSVGKQLAYILRGETKFDNLKKNKTAAGISVTFLGETIATGLKVEDRISIGKRLGLVASTGAVRAQGDVAYGANLEVRLRDKDYPIGQALSTLGLSLMKWRSDLALGANLQSQFSVGRNSKMAVRVGLNNKLTGQITVRTSTSDPLPIAFIGIIPLAIHIYRSIKSNESYIGH